MAESIKDLGAPPQRITAEEIKRRQEKAKREAMIDGMSAEEAARNAAAANAPPQPTVPSAPGAQAPEPVRESRARGSDVKAVQSIFTTWSTIAGGEDTPETVLGARFLAAKAEIIQPGDEIIIKHPRHLWRVHALVVATDSVARTVSCVPLHVHDLKNVAATPPDWQLARVDQLSNGKWRVLYGVETIRGNFSSRAEAEQWLREQQEGGPSA